MSDELREKVARAICRERCAFYGEPPCFHVAPDPEAESWNSHCNEPGCRAFADAAIALARAEAATRIEQLEATANNAYEERNRLVALLARLFPSGIKKTSIPGWDEAWHGCVYIDLPTGQASWHYHDGEAHLFEGLPPYSGEWDGHSTDEKYERIARAALEEPK